MTRNIVAVIQARMNSERLPGKVLMEISGNPMLWHIVQRLRYSKFINRIIVATGTSKKDDAIANFCEKYGIDFYRGSEEDVLDRYYQAAKIYRADPVVRVCADNPLTDPELVDEIIGCFLRNRERFDGASTTVKRTFPRGVNAEVLSFAAQEKAWKQARNGYHRELVTLYIYEHPELFNIYNVTGRRNLSHLRWTVDEIEDLEFVRQIYRRLYHRGNIFSWKEILRILEREPGLLNINRHIKQKQYPSAVSNRQSHVPSE